MPLTKGLRDEENERINNILKRLMSIVDVPGGFPDNGLDAVLKDLGLTTEILVGMSPEEHITWLQRLHFDWENAELMGDFLLALSVKSTTGKVALQQGALAVYEYIQKESKTFSFSIATKIASAKR